MKCHLCNVTWRCLDSEGRDLIYMLYTGAIMGLVKRRVPELATMARSMGIQMIVYTAW